MLRTCTGLDDSLVVKLSDGQYVPCDCRATFDDIDHSVVWPHTYIVDIKEDD